MKPWLSEPRGRQLEAFVGVWDVKTSQYESSGELIFDACILFDLNPAHFNDIEEAAVAIEALGKKERSERARRNRHLIASDIEKSSKPPATPVTMEGLEKMMAGSRPFFVDGASQDCVGELDLDPAKLLLKVVGAVIGHGHGHILYDFPELLEFTKSRIPGRSEVSHLHGIDQRMFEAKAKWPNLMPGADV